MNKAQLSILFKPENSTMVGNIETTHVWTIGYGGVLRIGEKPTPFKVFRQIISQNSELIIIPCLPSELVKPDCSVLKAMRFPLLVIYQRLIPSEVNQPITEVIFFNFKYKKRRKTDTIKFRVIYTRLQGTAMSKSSTCPNLSKPYLDLFSVSLQW